MEREQVVSIQNALCDFIIRASKENAPGYAVQALPETVKALIELSRFSRPIEESTKIMLEQIDKNAEDIIRNLRAWELPQSFWSAASYINKPAVRVEGRLINFEGQICIATKTEGIYCIDGIIASKAEEIGTDGGHFIRLVLEEIDEKHNNNSLINQSK